MGGKVVFVDFGRGKRPGAQGFGAGPRLVLGIFVGLLTSAILTVALFFPSAIGSGFFAPTVIAVAVALSLGVNRVIARIRMARLRAQIAQQTWGVDLGDETGRTLH